MILREFPGSQWLGLGAFIAGGTGSIPGWGTKISKAEVGAKKKKKKKEKERKKLGLVILRKA